MYTLKSALCPILMVCVMGACNPKNNNDKDTSDKDTTKVEKTDVGTVPEETDNTIEQDVPKQKQRPADSEERPEKVFTVETNVLAIDYKGKVGDEAAVMSLIYKGNAVSGTLHFLSSSSSISVKGKIDEDGNLVLYGSNSSKLVSTRHRRKRRFSGDYTVRGTTQHFKFRKGTIADDEDDLYQ